MGRVTLHVPSQRKMSSEGTPPCSTQAADESRTNPKELRVPGALDQSRTRRQADGAYAGSTWEQRVSL